MAPAAIINLSAPIKQPMIDPKTGLVTQPWVIFFDQVARKLNTL